MCPIYTRLFNIILDLGIVPDSWSLGDILPIYKNKGSIHQPENYRPITLLSCFGKLFTAILNTRISSYFDENYIIESCQAGFRKGFSTTDNLFIIQNLVEIAKGNKNKLFCAFVDFKQAFDTVWRDGLWQKMYDSRINGKCFEIIKNMYSNIKSRVSTAEGSTVFFPCQTGVRQGENLSPLLFSIFLNDLRHYLSTNGAQGVLCDSGDDENIHVFMRLFVLLFADDTVLFSKSKEDLQTALNIFSEYCTTWKLTINTAKTKVMIFSSGRQGKNLKFHVNGAELEIVNEYKYLGIYLARSGAFAKAKKHIVDQANYALFSLQRKIRHLNLPIDLQIELFNKMIKPILLYGCEIWGHGNLESIERVQLKFLKQILNLKKSTPSFMVYGEVGAYPLYVDIHTRIVSFWTKLGDNGINDTAVTLYKIISILNDKQILKSKWLNNIKNMRFSNGFGHIWETHDEVNRKWFVETFKQKLKDQYLQNWSSRVDQSPSGKNYRLFKNSFELNPYFTYLSNKESKLLTAFRTRNHHLPIEIGRWASKPITERTCNLCQDDIGDEYHYIMACRHFTDLRKQLIKPYYRTNINTLKFNELMNHGNKTTLKNLCKFIDIVMKTCKERNTHQ